MADLVIRGMEMPTEQRIEVLIFKNGFVAYYDVEGRYIGQAKAVPLPEGHGRMGDLDKLEESLRMAAAYQTGERQQGILGCCETIRMAKTIIPAEGGTDDV